MKSPETLIAQLKQRARWFQTDHTEPLVGPYVLLADVEAALAAAAPPVSPAVERPSEPIKQICAVCGLIYDPANPPACGSEDGPAGPKGVPPEARKFMKCVLGIAALSAGETPTTREQLLVAERDGLKLENLHQMQRAEKAEAALTAERSRLREHTTARLTDIDWELGRSYSPYLVGRRSAFQAVLDLLTGKA